MKVRLLSGKLTKDAGRSPILPTFVELLLVVALRRIYLGLQRIDENIDQGIVETKVMMGDKGDGMEIVVLGAAPADLEDVGPIAAQVIQMAAGDTTVGSRPMRRLAVCGNVIRQHDVHRQTVFPIRN
jgi:hypothetical protein